MKFKSLLLTCCLTLACCAGIQAQNCDQWIVRIYKELYNASPSAEECNIRNYNNGSWNSYDELTGYVKAYKSKATGNSNSSGAVKTVKLQGDPWIFKAYRELYRRDPVALELNVNIYNGGKWANYTQLKRLVAEFQSSLKKHNAQIRTVETENGNQLTGLYLNGEQVAVSLISKNGGNVVAAGGANVVSAGGANVVSAGGMNIIAPGGSNVVSAGVANVVSAGGANVVSAGGANISMHQNMAGLSFGARYTVQSAGTQVIPTSGSSALIIR